MPFWRVYTRRAFLACLGQTCVFGVSRPDTRFWHVWARHAFLWHIDVLLWYVRLLQVRVGPTAPHKHMPDFHQKTKKPFKPSDNILDDF